MGMANSLLEPMLHELERRAVITVVRAHPHWTLGQLFNYLRRAGEHEDVLGSVTLRELVAGIDGQQPHLPADGGPMIDTGRLEQAKRAEGANFDRFVVEALRGAPGAVAARYLRARVGGPRWKLQTSLRRLCDQRVVIGTGRTSDRRYRLWSAR